MKRIVICLLMFAVMLTGVMRVRAAEADMTVQVRTSKTEVQVGDMVEYTVLATGSGVVAMQFELRFPEGLRYVPNSGATPENLAQKLGVPAAEWTEISKMFTFYNDIGITFAKGTEILRFSCVAEKEGEWAVELYELLPFDEDFLEFPSTLQVQTVKVTDGAEDIKPTESDVTVGTTVPTSTETPTGQQTDEWTRPVLDPEQSQDQVTVDTSDEQKPDEVVSVVEPTPETQDETRPVQDGQPEEHTEGENWIWAIPVFAVIVGCGIVVYLLCKKKSS